MDEAIIIHTLNSLDDHFKLYLAILSHDAREKENLPTLETLSKALEDEELRLANQDRATANYARKEKKPDSKAKKDTNSKDANSNGSSNASKAPYLCTRCQKTHVKGECWMDKMTCNGCGKIGHIKKFCKKKEGKDKKEESNTTTPPEPSTKGLSCCLQRSVSLPTALNCIMMAGATTVAAASTPYPTPKVILDCGATDHFFCNRDFFTTYTEHYHKFQTGSGQILAAYGYGDVRRSWFNKTRRPISLTSDSRPPVVRRINQLKIIVLCTVLL